MLGLFLNKQLKPMIMKKSEIILFQLIFLLVVFLANNSPVSSQYGPTTLTGPRLGFTIISGEMADKLKDDYDAIPIVTQFGWQFEWRFFSLEEGTSGVVELFPRLLKYPLLMEVLLIRRGYFRSRGNSSISWRC